MSRHQTRAASERKAKSAEPPRGRRSSRRSTLGDDADKEKIEEGEEEEVQVVEEPKRGRSASATKKGAKSEPAKRGPPRKTPKIEGEFAI